MTTATACITALVLAFAPSAVADPHVPTPSPSATTNSTAPASTLMGSAADTSSTPPSSFIGLLDQVSQLRKDIATAEAAARTAQAEADRAALALTDAKVAGTLAQMRAEQAQLRLDSIASAMYRGDGYTPLTMANTALNANNADEFMSAAALADQVSAREADSTRLLLEQVRAVQQAQVIAQAADVRAKEASQQAQQQLDKMNASLAEAQKLLESVSGPTAQDTGPQTLVGPEGCPITAPLGTLRDGSQQLGVYQICADSVAQAATPAAALAIKWTLSQLGAPYACDGVGRMEPFRFDCSSLVSRAYFNGAGIPVAGLDWAPSTRNMVPWDGVSLDPWYSYVPAGQGRPGDLVLYHSCHAVNCQYQHVVMQLADGFKVHTSSCGDVAHVSAFSGPSDPDYIVTRRVLKNGTPGPEVMLPNVSAQAGSSSAAHPSAPTKPSAKIPDSTGAHGGEAPVVDPTTQDPNASTPVPATSTTVEPVPPQPAAP